MKTAVKPILYLLAAAVISVGLLFGAEAVTASLLEGQKNAAAREAFGELLAADDYEPLDTGAYGEIAAAYRAVDAEGAAAGLWGYRRGQGLWRRVASPCGAQRRRRPFCRYPDRGEP